MEQNNVPMARDDGVDLITNEAYHAVGMSERRPVGISVLAILYSLTAAWSFIAVMGFLLAPKVTAQVLNALYHLTNTLDFASYEIGDRLFSRASIL